MFSNVKKQVDKDDYKENHGKSKEGGFDSGIRSFAPLDINGNLLPISTNYEIPGAGTITLYDGKVRLVDTENFNHELQQFSKRKKQIEDLAEAFLISGDSMAIKYLSYYYNWLGPYQPSNQADVDHLIRCMVTDGYTVDQATKIFQEDIFNWDGRPNSITAEISTSERYVKKLNKLLWIIRYVGIVFTGKEVAPAPETHVPSGEKYVNPNLFASDSVKKEVKNARNFSDDTAKTVLGLDPPRY